MNFLVLLGGIVVSLLLVLGSKLKKHAVLALVFLFAFAGCKTNNPTNDKPNKHTVKTKDTNLEKTASSSFEYVPQSHWDYVVVKQIPFDLNVKPPKNLATNKTDEKLWNLDLHIRRNSEQEKQLNKCTYRDKRETWTKCKARLLALAQAKSLDVKSLELCLNIIEPAPDSHLVLAPLGAYAAHMGKEDIWIIVCQWEGEKNPPLPLAHIRYWAFTMKDCKQVAYYTCD